ncbi:restriction endonuclease subunit S [Aliivibrio sp. S3MY1]|uniref:restriction endonuclease subunit S n=1 Tax=unclassified Aliivibrio TaxID=2645654 RepID=UPI002378F8E1|nr:MULTISPECIES: restriction endonuclease subunit S [unclassified Aliivibrio]MDD9194619.1 restriction endonuclease subunit S [Aliivibrio sp. S3MY1]MDD9198541.1 restriction endonuclease subunit S [Aliivibrio sp. S2MY1]
MVPNGWEKGIVDDIAKVTSGGTPSRKKDLYWNGHIPWVTTSEVKFGIITDTEQKITQEGLDNSSAKLFPEDTILMAMYGQGKTRGQVAKLGIEASTNQACAALLLHKEHNVDYYYQYLTSQYENIRELANSGGQQNLSAGIIKDIHVPIPPLPEQRKIAQILSTWDKAITTTEKLIDASKQQKKALMQQLLTGKKRLVDPETGKAFEGEWLVQPLKHIGKLQAGKFVKASEISNAKDESLFPCYGGNGLRGFTASYTHEGLYSLIGRQGALCGNITLAEGKFHATEHAVVVTPHQNIDTKWLYYKLIELDLNQYATGQAQPGLSVKNLDPIEVLVAPVKEQQKIASVLTAADEEIKLLEAKLAHFKQEKKALMQQLLTGKRRVQVEAA